ncbi:MAG: N-formylglutamate amidohydrolase [Coriobacteriia bacterium]|nr:N-formylglutamate amidohydrolase [Coriobacteriia bacterium]
MKTSGFTDFVRIVDLGTNVVATAIHAGAQMRPDMASMCSLSVQERYREEDPDTDVMIDFGVTTLTVARSRFEVDVNRPRETAVYRCADDAWGLDLWQAPPDPSQVAASLRLWDEFYEAAAALLDEIVSRHERFVVFDVHSYNHRREGPQAPGADPRTDPEVNLGTRSLDRDTWAPVVEAFTGCVSAHGFDVAENVKFGGGHFPSWVNERYAGVGCALAIEFKKTFMDEWTGAVDDAALQARRTALSAAAASVSAVLEAREP